MGIDKSIYEVMRPMPPFRPELRTANRKGLKSQTRRVADQDFRMQKAVRVSTDTRGEAFDFIFVDETGMLRKCPYGKAGDYGYMREPLYRGFGGVAYYRDDLTMVRHALTGEAITWRWKKDILTSIFMPEEAARSIYRYAEIRVERVQEISHEDAVAEGCFEQENKSWGRLGYSQLWDEINAKRGYSWASNPWVWVLTYEPVEVQGG